MNKEIESNTVKLLKKSISTERGKGGGSRRQKNRETVFSKACRS